MKNRAAAALVVTVILASASIVVGRVSPVFGLASGPTFQPVDMSACSTFFSDPNWAQTTFNKTLDDGNGNKSTLSFAYTNGVSGTTQFDASGTTEVPPPPNNCGASQHYLGRIQIITDTAVTLTGTVTGDDCYVFLGKIIAFNGSPTYARIADMTSGSPTGQFGSSHNVGVAQTVSAGFMDIKLQCADTGNFTITVKMDTPAATLTPTPPISLTPNPPTLTETPTPNKTSTPTNSPTVTGTTTTTLTPTGSPTTTRTPSPTASPSSTPSSPTPTISSTATPTSTPTPQQVIQGCIDLVNGPVVGGSLNAGQKNALTAKLSAALDSVNRGNKNAAANQLRAFLNDLIGLSPDLLSFSQVQVLGGCATGVINQLGQ